MGHQTRRNPSGDVLTLSTVTARRIGGSDGTRTRGLLRDGNAFARNELNLRDTDGFPRRVQSTGNNRWTIVGS